MLLQQGRLQQFHCSTGPLTPNACSQVLTNYLVEVEKVTGDQMDEWRKNYSEAFERDYDPAYGTLFTAFVEGGN
jgi:trimethylamine-N-oxide reductase (cytochrome c)